MSDDGLSVDDLLPFLMGDRPVLWEGTDPEFAGWVHRTFGISPNIQTVTITPRAASGRAGVALAGREGAIIFVLENDDAARQLHIKPHLMGPIAHDQRVLRLANAAGGTTITEAVIGVLKRHLSVGKTLEYLTPPQAH